MKAHLQIFVCGTAVAVLVMSITSGCGQESTVRFSPAGNTADSLASTVDSSKFILADEPEGATGVIAARKEAMDGDEIVLIGRIGGSKKPWIEGRAAFMVIDASMSVVADGGESSAGEVCLDDCCASLRSDCTTLVKIVDTNDRVLSIDARDMLNVDVDDLVVVSGHVKRDEKEGTFVVIATGVHVRR